MARRSYSSAGPLEPFDLDGVEFHPVVSLLDLIDLVASVADIQVRTAAGMAALRELFRTVLAEDYERFASHVRTQGTRGETLMQILDDLFEDAMGPPTQPPPEGPGPVGGFADGRSSTGPTSSDGSPANSLDLGVVGILAQQRALSLSPDRAQALRAAVARIEAELAGSPPG